MEAKIKLRVQGLTNSQVQSGAYALILAEEKGIHRVPIIVGTAEAQSIAIALEKVKIPRPLTHDLFVAFAQTFKIQIREVLIYKYEDGIFYSELLLDDGFKQIRLDSRTSDAIAIALRVNCPIYATIKIITDCGVVLDDGLYELDDEEEEKWELMDLDPEEITDEYTLRRKLSFMREEDLVSRLEEAVKKENYEYAKMYKDELRRRKEEERESW
ncbi:MAG: bifunctional nuclease family protein [Parabacteroides sp.]|nr:bifunctional nuclease family protein [Parabacteroides sp.]